MSRRLKKFFWAIAIGLMTLGVVEIIARLYLGLGNPPLSVEHPTIEYMFAPNQDLMRFGNRIVINEYGMRTESFLQHNGTGQLRIMVFGDSVLNGGSLTDHSELATTLLGENLSRVLNSQLVIVGNISAGGWGPGNWLAYARKFGFFDADIIVLLVSEHDCEDNPSFLPLNPLTHPQEKPVLALIEGFTRYLPRYLPRISDSTPLSVSVEEGRIDATIQGLSDLRDFLKLARLFTDKVLVVQYPEKTELEKASLVCHLQIEEVAKEVGAVVISAAPSFRSAVKQGLDPYRDNIHPNSLGQAILANIFFEFLTKLHMIDIPEWQRCIPTANIKLVDSLSNPLSNLPQRVCQ